MLSGKNQNQEGGDNSQNYQANTNNVNNYGLSYRDAKDIAEDIFKSNFLAISQEALAVANERANKILEDFLAKLYSKNPELVNSLKEPSMQIALYSVQKDYAKTGDSATGDLLVDILIERAAHKERDLTQIVLDESLEVIPKLTKSQMDTLTLIFLMDESFININVENKYFENYIIERIKHFVDGIVKSPAHYRHIAYTNCASYAVLQGKIIENIKYRFRGVFVKEFYPSELALKNNLSIKQGNDVIIDLLTNGFLESNDDIVISLDDYFIKEEAYSGKKTGLMSGEIPFKFNVLRESQFDSYAEQIGKHKVSRDSLIELYKGKFMSNEEIENYLISIDSFMPDLIDAWENSQLGAMKLTSVGIAIARANLLRRVEGNINLENWINGE